MWIFIAPRGGGDLQAFGNWYSWNGRSVERDPRGQNLAGCRTWYDCRVLAELEVQTVGTGRVECVAMQFCDRSCGMCCHAVL